MTSSAVAAGTTTDAPEHEAVQGVVLESVTPVDDVRLGPASVLVDTMVGVVFPDSDTVTGWVEPLSMTTAWRPEPPARRRPKTPTEEGSDGPVSVVGTKAAPSRSCTRTRPQ